MQVRADQIQEGGVPCGCHRSPTGKCIGWHALSESEFQAKLAEWELDNYRKEAEALWFTGGSCTGGRPE